MDFNLAMLNQVQHDGVLFITWQLNKFKTVPHPSPPRVGEGWGGSSRCNTSVLRTTAGGEQFQTTLKPQIPIFAQSCGGNRFTFPTLQFFVTLNSFQGRRGVKIALPTTKSKLIDFNLAMLNQVQHDRAPATSLHRLLLLFP